MMKAPLERPTSAGLFRQVSDGSDEKGGGVSRLSNLLRQVEPQDPQLAADLKREMEALSGRRAFGLNFERPCCMDHPEGCLIIGFFNAGGSLNAT